jgi:hypothetical protein
MSILDQLVKEIQQKHDSPVGTHQGPNVHGPHGLFGVPGLERDVISSRITASGLAAALPVQGSVTKYPLFAYLTGRTTPTGDQPEAHCDDGPVAGNFKSCLQTAQFGIYQFRTRELEINTVGALVNAGETTDLRFVNDPLAEQLGRMFPNITDREFALQLGREVLMRFVDVGYDFQDLVSQQIYTGSGLANEFPGLELLVVESHYDAKTGQLCEALASDVRDFGDVDVTTSPGAQNIVTQLVSMYRENKYNSAGMRMDPVTRAFVMREQLFVEITDVWPCSYLSSRCVPANENVNVHIDTMEQVRMRNEMRSGKFLWIDGERVPVITDNFLPETDLGNNVHSSDIYLLPLTIRGGQPVLYWEHFDYSRGTMQAVRDGRLSNDFWTDRGLYMWHKKPPQNWCTQWQAKIEPRLILRTPQIAGRLMNVAATLDKHWRDPNPASEYYVNGGVSTGYDPGTLYNNWNNAPVS